MLNGNISNWNAPIVAFNVDNLLFIDEPVDKNLMQRIKSIIFTMSDEEKFFGRKLNEDFVNLINNTWNRHDLSIYMLTTHNEYVSHYEQLFYELDLCYTRVQSYAGITTLQRLVDYRYLIYVDNDRSILSQVGGKGMHIDNFPLYLARFGGSL